MSEFHIVVHFQSISIFFKHLSRYNFQIDNRQRFQNNLPLRVTTHQDILRLTISSGSETIYLKGYHTRNFKNFFILLTWSRIPRPLCPWRTDARCWPRSNEPACGRPSSWFSRIFRLWTVVFLEWRRCRIDRFLWGNLPDRSCL